MANKKGKEPKSASEKIQETRQEIVDEVIKLLESDKKLDWSMGWSGPNLRPHNPVSGAQYQGVNRFRLAFAAIINDYHDPRWCTFAQAKAQDWQVKRGSKGVLCESFIFEREVKDLDENGNEKRDEKGNIVYKKEKLEKPIRTTFTVFNASQILGIPKLPQLNPPSTDFQLEVAKNFIASSDCPITYAAQKRAFYDPGLDRICVPPKEFFKDEKSFFATVTHEMGHSTGHESRLDRNMGGSFGSKSYAKEELVAELCSMFTQSNLNIELKGEHFENHAAYLQSWISILKDDPNELFIAAEKASKAADYLYDRYLDYRNEKLKDDEVEVCSNSNREVNMDKTSDKNLKENAASDFKFSVGENNNNNAIKRAAQAYSNSSIVNTTKDTTIEKTTPKNIDPRVYNYVPTDAITGIPFSVDDQHKLNKLFIAHKFTNKLWVTDVGANILGGRIKKGANPVSIEIGLNSKGRKTYRKVDYYNLDQTIDCDLMRSPSRDLPSIKAYIEAQSPQQNPSQQQAHESTSKQAPVLESFGNKELDDRIKKISKDFGFIITDKNEITAAVDTVKSFNTLVINDKQEKLENKPDQERDTPRARVRTKEHRNKDIER